MIYAMIDLVNNQVAEVISVMGKRRGKPDDVLLKELSDVYRETSGDKDTTFADLSDARAAVLKALRAKYTKPAPRFASGVRPDATNPVAVARAIFDELAGEPRRVVIEACARAGVKRSTAATQYQRWRTARKK